MDTNKDQRKFGRVRRLRDFIALAWLLAALAIVLLGQTVTAQRWVLIHVIMLGALSHSVLVWSEYFTRTLTRTATTEGSAAVVRMVLLALGGVFIVIGYPSDVPFAVLIGAALVIASTVWHGGLIFMLALRALPGRFRKVNHYYLWASIMLPLGATIGVFMAFGVNDEWRGRLILSHLVFNFLGWIGLTVTGTLVTFWPTIVRARMHERTEMFARQALPFLITGIAILAGGALLGIRAVSIGGFVSYVIGLCLWSRLLWAPLRAKGLRDIAPASVAASLIWAGTGLGWLAAVLARARSWADIPDLTWNIPAVLVGGFALQLLIGALSYLIPMLFGGGPSVVRATTRALNLGATFRVLVTNVSLLIWLMPIAQSIKISLAILGIFSVASFIPILVYSLMVGIREKRLMRSDEQLPSLPHPPTNLLKDLSHGN
ncbi:hypothetical protein [Arcanobacterium phocae]|uniref:hypothetical protein n=1 Tax=Arcanobacterium phocae TaxID=131112 RepID=UPI001C0EEC4C|nr:hypothetical protein [Arcanobacterium phocae]